MQNLRFLASRGDRVNNKKTVSPCRSLRAFPDYSETVEDAAKLPTQEMLLLTRLGERHRFGRSRIWGSRDNGIYVVKIWSKSANSVFLEELVLANVTYVKLKIMKNHR